MKQVTIENIIKSIASREIYDDVRRSGVYEAFFPDEELTNFLAYAVAQKLFVDVEYLGVTSGTYGEITCILPELVKRKNGYDFGFYLYGKRKFSYFEHFFRFFYTYFIPIRLRASDGSVFNLLNRIDKTEIKTLFERKISEINKDWRYNYDAAFCEILAKNANTEKPLKMIIANINGDFFVTESRIWAIKHQAFSFYLFENQKRNCRYPDAINLGRYFSAEQKIIQIIDGENVLYSGFPFDEREFDWRKNYQKMLLGTYQSLIK